MRREERNGESITQRNFQGLKKLSKLEKLLKLKEPFKV
jgi:hypothetical protein